MPSFSSLGASPFVSPVYSVAFEICCHRERADAFLRIPAAIPVELIADRRRVFHCRGSGAAARKRGSHRGGQGTCLRSIIIRRRCAPSPPRSVGWAKPTGPAGACHRAGQRPDPLGRPMIGSACPPWGVPGEHGAKNAPLLTLQFPQYDLNFEIALLGV